MRLIFLVLLVACATAELSKYSSNLYFELLMNVIKTLTPYFSIDNSLKDATQLEALKNNVVEDNIKELNESLVKIEEGNIISYLDFIYQLNN